MQKTTVVLGASENPERYSRLAVESLQKHNHPVIAIGRREGKIGDTSILRGFPEIQEKVDTVSLYLNPKNQEMYYDYIVSLQPRRIIFNPGTENETLRRLAVEKNIVVLEACTLVLLSTGQF